MLARIQIRRDSKVNWEDTNGGNPVLHIGEIGYDTTTKKFKIGDGVTNWNNLPYQLGQWDGEVNGDISFGYGNVNIANNLQIDGNLFVKGTTTTVNTKEVTFNDRMLTLNWNENPIKHYDSSLISGIDVNIGWPDTAFDPTDSGAGFTSVSGYDSTNNETVITLSSALNNFPTTYKQNYVIYFSDTVNPFNNPELAFFIKSYDSNTNELTVTGDASAVPNTKDFEIHNVIRQLYWKNDVNSADAAWYVDGNKIWHEGNLNSNSLSYLPLSGGTLTGNLDVEGEINFSGTRGSFVSSLSQPRIYRSGSESGTYPFDDFGHLILQTRTDGSNRDIVFATGTDGANLTVIKSDGKVGIGTTSPDSLFEVEKNNNILFDATDDSGQRDGTATIQISNQDGSVNSFSQLLFDTAGTGQSIARIAAVRVGNGSNDLAFALEHGDTKHEAMRIKSTGYIGIGTSDPDQDLFGSAEKILHMKSSNVATLRLESTHSGGSDFEISAGNSLRNVYMWNKSNGGISFGANNSEAMYITNAGKVGIGRTIANPPSEKLHVDGGSLRVDIGTTPDSAAIFAGGGSNLHIDLDSGYSTFRNTAGDTSGSGFRFKSISNDLVTIQNDGNVGIGQSPTNKLSVNGRADFDRIVFTNAYQAGTENWIISTGDTGTIGGSNGYTHSGGIGLFANATYHSSGNFSLQDTSKLSASAISVQEDGHIRFAAVDGLSSTTNVTLTSSYTRMTIEPSGKVGIGTQSPNYELTIAGGTSNSLQILSSTTGTTATDGLRIWNTGLSCSLWNYDNTPTLFGTNNLERMRIDADGNVGIGTTSPSQLLQVGGDKRGQIYIKGTDSASPTLTLDHTSYTNGRKWALYSGGARAANFDILDLSTTPNATPRFSIDENGKVGIGTTSPDELLHLEKLTDGVNEGNPGIVLENSDQKWAIFNRGSSSDRFQINDMTDPNATTAPFRIFPGAPTDSIHISGTGKVGIGVTNPVDKFEVEVHTGEALRIVNTAGTMRGYFGRKVNGEGHFGIFDASSNERIHLDTTAHSFFTGAGNVGIGTTNPTEKLHVYTDTSMDHVMIDGTSGIHRSLGFATSGVRRWQIYADNVAEAGSDAGTNFRIARYSDTGTYLGLGMEIMRESGNVSLGGGAGALEKLQVNGAIKLGTTTNNNSGTIRYNTTTNDFEGNTDGTSGGWTSLTSGGSSSTQTQWTLTANGTSDYIFSGPGIYTGNTNDPDIFLVRGQTYSFDNQSGGHPFEIRTSPGSTPYSDGVSQSGTVTTFTVPMNAPSLLYYQCTSHSSMLGNIYISSNELQQGWKTLGSTNYGASASYDYKFYRVTDDITYDFNRVYEVIIDADDNSGMVAIYHLYLSSHGSSGNHDRIMMSHVSGRPTMMRVVLDSNEHVWIAATNKWGAIRIRGLHENEDVASMPFADSQLASISSPQFNETAQFIWNGDTNEITLLPTATLEGKLGIGTNSPSYELEVDGKIHASDGIHVLDRTSAGDITPNNWPSKAISTFLTDDIAGSTYTWDSGITVRGYVDGGIPLQSYRVWQLFSNSSADLDISGDSATADDLYFRSGTGGSWGTKQKVWTDANLPLGSMGQWTTSGNDIHYSSGNVGIGTGTTSPTSPLEVMTSNDTRSGGIKLRSSSSGGRTLNLWATGTKAYIDAGAGNVDLILNSAGGNVGIGTTSPSAPLHIKSATDQILKLQTSDQATNGPVYMGFYDSADAQKGWFGYGSNLNEDVSIWNTEAGAVKFATSNTQRMIIQSNGNVGIGVSSANHHLGVYGNIMSYTNTAGTQIACQIGVSSGAGLFRVFDSTGSSNSDVVFKADGSIKRVGILTNSPSQQLHVVGNILATGTVTENSDITLKENLEVIKDPIEKVKQINGYTYNMINNEEEKMVGLVAQEVEEILPELIFEDDDGIKSLAYGHVVALLVECIKKQDERIESLEKKLEELS